MVYTVTLNPALDYVMHVPALQYDDINRTSGEEIFYGGKGINVSVVCHRLGIETTALGFVGGFTGIKLEQMLQADGVRTDFVHIEGGDTRINVKIKADTELDINAKGPAVSEAEVDELMKKIEKIGEGDCLVLAGSIPKTLPNDIYESIMAKLTGKGVKFIVDAEGELLLKVLKYKPFLVKPNHHELGGMFGVKTETDEEIETYARKLQEMGTANVLVSRASKGALLLDENGEVHKIGVAEGKLKNSVGAGDSMVAGFVSGCIIKNDYAYALKLGTACGGATAFSESLATKEEIYTVLEQL